ncbi:MAG: 5-carboxymethyl-2-hydroxymuconate isomerase, partial [Gammaproteobacteria bacterium]
MPHCIIEYSKTLENKLSIKELVSLVHGSVFASEL